MTQRHKLRQTPVWHALHRPNLVFGCDRELVLSSGLVIVAMIWAALSGGLVLVAILSGALWMRIVSYLRLMAKADPRMRGVYLRHRRYRAYYPARSTPFCRH
jgi:type IV secretion system protein TrbD